MLQVIAELNGLLEKAQLVTKDHEQRTKELNEREALCINKESDLKLRKQNLDSREALLVPIENMAQWKKGVQDLEASVREEKDKLEADKKVWATQVQIDKQQIEEDRKLSKREADNNEANRKNLDAQILEGVKNKLVQFGHPEIAAKLAAQ